MKTRRRESWTNATLLVFAIVLLAYVRTIDFGFTYDDHHHYLKNPFVRDLTNLRELLPWRYFAREFPDQGRPLLVVSQFVDSALGGKASAAHLQSALWHALAAVLVLALAKSLGFSVFAGVVSAIAFGLHPVNVEAVAGIANREDLLATVAGLAALLAAQRALAGARLWLVVLGAAYTAALAAKESALAVPILLGVLALCSTRYRPPAPAARRSWLSVGLVLAGVTLGFALFQLRLGYPSLVPGAGGAALEHAALRARPPALVTLAGFRANQPPSGPVRRPHAAVRLHDTLPLEAFRAAQLAFAAPTAPEYDPSWLTRPAGFVLGLLSLSLIAAAALRDLARGSGRIALGAGWFFGASVPVLLPMLLLNPLADRYLYFPSIGFALLVGWLIGARLPDHFARPDAAGWAGLALGAVYFVVMQTSLEAWRDDVSLFSKAARFAPSSARVHQNLGSALLRESRLDEAERELSQAVVLEPRLTAAHVNLAILAEQRGRRGEAIEHYQRALDSQPVAGELALAERACTRLGTLLFASGQHARMRQLLAREGPRRPACRAALGNMLEPGAR